MINRRAPERKRLYRLFSTYSVSSMLNRSAITDKTKEKEKNAIERSKACLFLET